MQVLKSELSLALRALAPAVGKSRHLPILEGVRLTFDGSLLRLQATDLTFGVERSVEGSGDPFDTVLPFKLLAELVKSAGPSVSLTASGVDGVDLGALDPNDFPNLFGWQDVDGTYTPTDFAPRATVEAGAFSALLSRVAYAADGAKGYRETLKGVYLEGKRGTLTAVCADGYRLALGSLPYGGPDFKLLPPARLADVLKAQKAEGLITLSESPNAAQACITFQGGRIMARLIEGTFPDFRQIIPHETKGSFTVDASALADAMKALRPFTKTNNDVARFHLGEMNGSLTVSGKHENGAELRRAVVVEHSGEFQEAQGDAPSRWNKWTAQEPTKTIAFNEKFVSDLAAAHKGKRLTVGVNSPNFAAKITVDGEAVAVLMPMVVGRD